MPAGMPTVRLDVISLILFARRNLQTFQSNDTNFIEFAQQTLCLLASAMQALSVLTKKCTL